MRRLFFTIVFGVLLIGAIYLWPRPGYLLAINTYDGEDYRVVMMRPGETAEIFQPACEAAWTYGAREGRIYAVVRADGATPDLSYSPSWCDPLPEGEAMPIPLAVYDSYAGFGPDGRIVSAVREGDRVNLVLLDVERGSAERLTDDDFRNSDPDWSPDGSTILFRSTRGGSSDLWTLALESGEMTQLTDDPDNDGVGGYGGEGPGRYSPDGTRIVWNCVDEAGRSNVCIMRADGTRKQQLTPGRLADEGLYPSWHPLGQRIVYGATEGEGYALYEISVHGGEPVRIAGQPATSNLGAVWVEE